MLIMDRVSVSLFYISVSSPYFAHFVAHFISSHVVQYLDYIFALPIATPTRRPFSGHGGHALGWRSHGHSLVGCLSVTSSPLDSAVVLPVSALSGVHLPVRALSGGDDVTGRQPRCGRDFAR